MLPHRSRSRFRWPITLSASLIAANLTLMVLWIVLFARLQSLTALTVGAIAFALILVGLSFWLVLTIKEIRLNHRQANFIDSVTHELKSPIAAVQLWLETLRKRTLDETGRDEIYGIMAGEIARLDQLINQLLEAGRLDNIGQDQEEVSIELLPLVVADAQSAAVRHGVDFAKTVRLSGDPVVIPARQIMAEIVFSNLIDNAFKYGGHDGVPIDVRIVFDTPGPATVKVSIASNSPPVAAEDRRRIFRIFERGGNELERRQKGTGLGLYIVQTLVRRMRGQVIVQDRSDGLPGTEFVVTLPGRRCDSPTYQLAESRRAAKPTAVPAVVSDGDHPRADPTPKNAPATEAYAPLTPMEGES